MLLGFTFIVLDEFNDGVEGAFGIDVASLCIVHHTNPIMFDSSVIRLANIHHPDGQSVRFLV